MLSFQHVVHQSVSGERLAGTLRACGHWADSTVSKYRNLRIYWDESHTADVGRRRHVREKEIKSEAPEISNDTGIERITLRCRVLHRIDQKR